MRALRPESAARATTMGSVPDEYRVESSAAREPPLRLHQRNPESVIGCDLQTTHAVAFGGIGQLP